MRPSDTSSKPDTSNSTDHDATQHTLPTTEHATRPLPCPAPPPTLPRHPPLPPDPHEPAPVPDGFMSKSGRTVHRPKRLLTLIHNADIHPH
ncbi:hypothetical protein Pcinc_004720 [Petrolisthes cinctipes]|uniref:Uncharacterized protein n=1 Tax=Petrolisthes cinctipes TaxID=88211 RepID=A0AAE1GGJ4_PETCI|nr:hypothetical protein Pcinc_004720 [Petrolisthes cinctipes]